MNNRFFPLFTLVLLSLFAVSCGNAPSNVLQTVKVETRPVDGDIVLDFSAELDLGAMSFSSIALPIIHPQGNRQIGQLELASTLGGKNQIRVQLNVSEVSGLRSEMATLPNGNMIPLIANNQTIAIGVGNGAKIYLTLAGQVAALGVAVPISAFDNIGQTVPGLNLFPIVRIENIVGTAGIFTGARPGQSGIAVVADLSQVVNLNPSAPVPVPSLQESGRMALALESVVHEEVKLDYRSHVVPSRQKTKMDDILYGLHKRKAVLRMR